MRQSILILSPTDRDLTLIQSRCHGDFSLFWRADLDNLVTYINEILPACVVVSEDCNHFKPLQVVSWIRELHSDIPIIIIAETVNDQVAISAFREGVTEICLKADIDDDLLTRVISHPSKTSVLLDEGDMVQDAVNCLFNIILSGETDNIYFKRSQGDVAGVTVRKKGKQVILTHRNIPRDDHTFEEACQRLGSVFFKTRDGYQPFVKYDIVGMYKRLIDTMDEGVLMLDRRGRVTMGNKKVFLILGSTPKDTIGESMVDLVASSFQDNFNMRLNDNLKENIRFESELKNKKGGNVPVAVGMTPIRDTRDQYDGCFLTITDITEQKRVESVLKEANLELQKITQMKSEFVSRASHELRTPLAVIMNAVEVLETAVQDVSKLDTTTRILSTVMRNAQRLMLLIDDLLDFSKIESGRLSLTIAPCDVQDLSNDILHAMVDFANRRGVHLISEINTPALVLCDYNRIIQVLVNLVSNAIKFTPEGQSITVSGRINADGMYEFSVSDQGIGIATEDCHRIFEQFYQVSIGRGPNQQKGTGLGLAICKEIVKLHNGSIWVESQVGVGSTFFFTLPLNGAQRDNKITAVAL